MHVYLHDTGDVPLTFADTSRARELLGYRPKVSIRDGVRKFVEWFKDYTPVSLPANFTWENTIQHITSIYHKYVSEPESFPAVLFSCYVNFGVWISDGADTEEILPCAFCTYMQVGNRALNLGL